MPKTRKQIEARAAAVADVLAGRFDPPADLDRSAAAIWRELIAATPPSLLSLRDKELLRSYCSLAAVQKKLLAHIGAMSAEELIESPAVKRADQLASRLTSMAAKLKLTPLAQAAAPDKATIRRETSAPPELAAAVLGDDGEPPLLGGYAALRPGAH